MTLERIQDQSRAGGFSIVELFLANGDDRSNLSSELGVRSDFDGSALNFANVALDIPLICLELDVL